MIDCNNFWDVPYTLEMAQRLAAHRLYWIEEPISPDDIDGYEVLCREIRNTRIASGNFEYTRWGFRELIRHKAVHVLLPDMSWAGGLTELRRIDAMAGAQGLPVVPHRSGSLYGLAFALASPNCPFVESFGIGEPGNEILRAMTPRFESGYYYASDKPGFGVEIPESDLRRYTRG
jgi:L-rhamnonate dehydratase